MSVTHLNPERMHDLTMPRDLRANALQAHWQTLDNAAPHRRQSDILLRALETTLGVDASSAIFTWRRVYPSWGEYPVAELDGLHFTYRHPDGLCLLDREGTVYQVGSLADLGRLLSELGEAL